MIAKETIDKVFDTARVEEVIGDFVQLRRSGANYKGLSPFSNERTPSFMVSPAKQIWKDFSSGKGGNTVSFLMEHERFSFVEAIRYLAKKYNIEIVETQNTEEDKIKVNQRESLFLVNEFARDFFIKSLRETPQGKAIGLTYFKERGFTDQTIKDFELGYSPDAWSAFTDEALKSGYELSYLQQTGLTIVKEGNSAKIDRFKGRVIFPIHSMSGRVLGFGGRILSQDKKTAKYLNSPESEIYHKSQVLYGIFQAKQHITRQDNCYLVEGYTDVIQLHQRGIKNVVASSGTALTTEQIRLIHRLTNNITVLYDGDAAGLRAAIRGVDMILEQGMNVKICTFPEGEDPDSFARKNSHEDLLKYLEENAQDFIRFKASLLMKDAANDPLKRAETVRDLVESISKIPDAIKREIYLQESAAIMQVSENTLFTTLAQLTKKALRKADKNYASSAPKAPVQLAQNKYITPVNPQETYENDLIRHLLLYGSNEYDFQEVSVIFDENGEEHLQTLERKMPLFEKIYVEMQEDEMENSSAKFQKMYQFIIAEYQKDTAFDPNAHMNKIPVEFAQEFASIYLEEENLKLHNWERKEILVKDKQSGANVAVEAIILNIRRLFLIEKIKQLMQNVKDREATEQERQEVMDYLSLQKLINKKLDRVIN